MTLCFPRIILGVEQGIFGSTFKMLFLRILPEWQKYSTGSRFLIERRLVTRGRCVHTRGCARGCYFARCSREFLESLVVQASLAIFPLPIVHFNLSPLFSNSSVFVHGVQLFCFLSFNNLMKTEDSLAHELYLKP